MRLGGTSIARFNDNDARRTRGVPASHGPVKRNQRTAMSRHRGLSITLVLLTNVLSGSTSSHSACEFYQGNGVCDKDLNKEECSWDGGDCCECTCVNGLDFDCGSESYDCRDPDAGCTPPPTPMPILRLSPQPIINVSSGEPTTVSMTAVPEKPIPTTKPPNFLPTPIPHTTPAPTLPTVPATFPPSTVLTTTPNIPAPTAIPLVAPTGEPSAPSITEAPKRSIPTLMPPIFAPTRAPTSAPPPTTAPAPLPSQPPITLIMIPTSPEPSKLPTDVSSGEPTTVSMTAVPEIPIPTTTAPTFPPTTIPHITPAPKSSPIPSISPPSMVPTMTPIVHAPSAMPLVATGEPSPLSITPEPSKRPPNVPTSEPTTASTTAVPEKPIPTTKSPNFLPTPIPHTTPAPTSPTVPATFPPSTVFTTTPNIPAPSAIPLDASTGEPSAPSITEAPQRSIPTLMPPIFAPTRAPTSAPPPTTAPAPLPSQPPITLIMIPTSPEPSKLPTDVSSGEPTTISMTAMPEMPIPTTTTPNFPSTTIPHTTPTLTSSPILATSPPSMVPNMTPIVHAPSAMPLVATGEPSPLSITPEPSKRPPNVPTSEPTTASTTAVPEKPIPTTKSPNFLQNPIPHTTPAPTSPTVPATFPPSTVLTTTPNIPAPSAIPLDASTGEPSAPSITEAPQRSIPTLMPSIFDPTRAPTSAPPPTTAPAPLPSQPPITLIIIPTSPEPSKLPTDVSSGEPTTISMTAVPEMPIPTTTTPNFPPTTIPHTTPALTSSPIPATSPPSMVPNMTPIVHAPSAMPLVATGEPSPLSITPEPSKRPPNVPTSEPTTASTTAVPEKPIPTTKSPNFLQNPIPHTTPAPTSPTVPATFPPSTVLTTTPNIPAPSAIPLDASTGEPSAPSITEAPKRSIPTLMPPIFDPTRAPTSAPPPTTAPAPLPSQPPITLIMIPTSPEPSKLPTDVSSGEPTTVSMTAVPEMPIPTTTAPTFPPTTIPHTTPTLTSSPIPATSPPSMVPTMTPIVHAPSAMPLVATGEPSPLSITPEPSKRPPNVPTSEPTTASTTAVPEKPIPTTKSPNFLQTPIPHTTPAPTSPTVPATFPPSTVLTTTPNIPAPSAIPLDASTGEPSAPSITEAPQRSIPTPMPPIISPTRAPTSAPPPTTAPALAPFQSPIALTTTPASEPSARPTNDNEEESTTTSPPNLLRTPLPTMIYIPTVPTVISSPVTSPPHSVPTTTPTVLEQLTMPLDATVRPLVPTLDTTSTQMTEEPLIPQAGSTPEPLLVTSISTPTATPIAILTSTPTTAPTGTPTEASIPSLTLTATSTSSHTTDPAPVSMVKPEERRPSPVPDMILAPTPQSPDVPLPTAPTTTQETTELIAPGELESAPPTSTPPVPTPPAPTPTASTPIARTLPKPTPTVSTLPAPIVLATKIPTEFPTGIMPSTLYSPMSTTTQYETESPISFIGTPESTSPTTAPGNVRSITTLAPEWTQSPVPYNITLDPAGAPMVSTTLMSRTVSSESVSIAAAGGVAASVLGTILLSREAGAAMVATAAGGAGQAFRSTSVETRDISIRMPSAILAFILMSQLQFLATLSLVDSNTTVDEPWLRDLGVNLRWLNLWLSGSLPGDTTTGGDASRRSLTSSSTCNWEDTGFSLSIGNVALMAGILFCIFLLHLLIVSGVEAHWLLEKRAKADWEGAQRRGITESELLARIFRKPVFQRVLPVVNDDLDTGGVMRAASGKARTLLSTPNVDMTKDGSGRDNDASEEKENRDQEKGILATPCPPHSTLHPIVECRDMSASAWLHFPHVELVFLFFAFEGFVAAQVSGIRHTECLPVLVTAIIMLVLYPVLMFVGVCRTTLAQVCPNIVLEFREFPNGEGKYINPSTTRLKHGHSLFSWADKGRWQTVPTYDEGLRRKRNWFRIGFEPMFVNFTQFGAWFAIFYLFEWTLLAFVAAVITSGVVQLFLFCVIHLGTFAMLMVFRPFANSAMDLIASMVALTNGVSMVFMAVSTLAWKGTPRGRDAQIAIVCLQLLALSALVIPIYIDVAAVIMATISRKIESARSETKPNAKQENSGDQHAQTFVRGFVRRGWLCTWYSLLGDNIRAYMTDLRHGIWKLPVTHWRVRPSTS